ncbi:MAG: acetylglutamate kinase [Victivallaceae bacterium]|nr:acetylglutamate kinase [Victivallaceae bacterium]
MKEVIDKAMVLIEALPYIQKFRDAVVVVKFGGSAMEDPELVKSTMRDIVFMECIGMRPVVVHGGGKAISAELKRQNIKVEFVNGLRNTCADTIKIVDNVLHEHVNKSLLEHGKAVGGRLTGISGKKILSAEKLFLQCPDTGKNLDIGFVGNIIDVNTKEIYAALEQGLIPVIPPLGVGSDGQVYNINADIAACKITEALKARKLIFLSDVPGILRDPNDESSVIGTVRTDEVQKLIDDKVITGGMLPKIKSSLHALEAGTNKVHMIDGRLQHSLLLEIFTTEGIGTQIVKADSI